MTHISKVIYYSYKNQKPLSIYSVPGRISKEQGAGPQKRALWHAVEFSKRACSVKYVSVQYSTCKVYSHKFTCI